MSLKEEAKRRAWLETRWLVYYALSGIAGTIMAIAIAVLIYR